MPIQDIDDVDRLRKINAALISRVERSMDQQGNAFSLFQTAINLENRVRSRTEELRSTLRRLEQSNSALVAAKENAEQANQSKTRFLAAASHDVLQPLNAAHLSVSALAEIQNTDEGHTLVRQVERSLETMEDLLHTLLDISKLDAGVVKPELGDVALEPLLASIMADFQPLAARKGIALRSRAGGAVVRSDRTLLRRILQNIVSNAVRYTTNGRRAGRRRASAAPPSASTSSTPAAASRTTSARPCSRNSTAVPSPSTARCPSAASGSACRSSGAWPKRSHHPIGFSSRVGRGTGVPAGNAGRAAPAPSTLPPPSTDAEQPRGYGLFGTRVLLVENDPARAEAMTALLESWQCDVRAAASTSEAMAQLGDTHWIAGRRHRRPASRRRRSGQPDRSRRCALHLLRNVPALIVTGDASSALAQAARASGIELMRKPVKPAQLRALLAHLLA